jgi:hypothetical protein
MSFTSKSESVPVVVTFNFGEMGPAMVTSLGERFSLIREHVGAGGGEALVVDHVALLDGACDVSNERHGVRRKGRRCRVCG